MPSDDPRDTTSLDALAAAIEWPDAEAAADARATADPLDGRLAELREWLAATRGTHPPKPLQRARCLVLGDGPATEAREAIAESVGAGVRSVEVSPSTSIDSGLALADDEIDSGADLLVVAAGSGGPSLAVLVSVLTGAEPIALLPRGAAAVDTAAWIERATTVRDTRRAVADLRREPVRLLEHLGDDAVTLTVGVVLRAVARRTPLVLDGPAALVAGLLVSDLASRAARWWQIADTAPDAVSRRAVAELGREPLLDLGIARGDGTAGLLCLPLLRAAEGDVT